MNYTYSFPFSWVLAFQVFILTVLSKVDQAAIIGYHVANNTIKPYYCPRGSWIRQFSDEAGSSYLFCDFTTTKPNNRIGTACEGNNALYITTDEDQISTISGTWTCSKDYPCITVTVYEYYEGGDGSGLQYLISCQNYVFFSGRADTLFEEHPTACKFGSLNKWKYVNSEAENIWATDSATAFITEKELDWPTDEPSGLATTDPTSVSTRIDRIAVPTATEDPDEGKDGNARVDSPGIVAGIVIGSLAAVALICVAIFLAFRMGRKKNGTRRHHETQRKSFREKLRSLPRPSIIWARPVAKDEVKTETTHAELPASLEPETQITDRITQTNPPPIIFEAMASESIENPRIELPTDLEPLGWARTEAHQNVFEADANQADKPPAV